MSKLKNLTSQLYNVKATLINLDRTVAKVNLLDPTSYDLSDITLRHERWKPLLETVESILIKMHELTDDEDEIEQINNERYELSEQYYKIGRVLSTIINRSKQTQIFGESSGTQPLADDDIKLASINIPVFSGNIENWGNFKATFESLVHNSSKHGNHKKILILRNSLKGEALDIISSVPIESAYYQTCWDLLVKFYDNKRKIISHHLNSFLTLPPLASENSNSLRTLAASMRKHIKALENIIPTENRWDHIVAILISKKLDSETRRHWLASNVAKNDYQDIESILSFIVERAHELDENAIERTKPNRQRHSKAFFVNNTKCSYCNKGHSIIFCDSLSNLSVKDRIKECKNKKLCFICLSKGHSSQHCRSKVPCQICNKLHHSFLHLENFDYECSNPTTANVSTFTTQVKGLNQAMLSTALVNIHDKHGKKFTVRTLLDNGSQTSFISKELADKLSFPTSSSDITISGIGNTTTKISKIMHLHLHSLVNNYRTRVSCLVIDKIADNIPHENVSINNLEIPDHIRLADPQFNIPNSVDMLLGADVFWNLLRIGNTRISHNQISLQNTSFGWVVTRCKVNFTKNNMHCYHITLRAQLSKFWEVESVKDCSPYTAEEKACQDHFDKTIERDSNGRFVVTLPFKGSPSTLGETKHVAVKRFYALERKFAKDKLLKQMYADFIHEYSKLGHMTLANVHNDSEPKFYLPHHGILKHSSTTSKLRVVFDGSALSSANNSLNSLLANGPTIQRDLFSIIVNFRIHKYVVIADIAMMYRQILLQPSQRPLQQILWRDNPDEQIKAYQLNTLTYGTLSAAYLAIKCLNHLGNSFMHTHPKAAQSITQDFYVDDLLTGSDDVSELKERCHDIIEILKSAGFPLRKWISNNSDVINNLGDPNLEKHFFVQKDSLEGFKALGVRWCAVSDTFRYDVSHIPPPDKLTKRTLLSFISKFFDPMGFLTPCIILLKLIIQQLWLLNIKWDDEVPQQVVNLWQNSIKGLQSINEVSVPRRILLNDCVVTELHGFCDASERAYGACIYIKGTSSKGVSNVSLIHSKSKVAPLKTLSIPSLELCAALLLSRMVKKLLGILSIPIKRIILWSDSEVVLSWLKKIPNTLPTFVANRISEIQTDMNSIAQWRHVRTNSNPADLISRGIPFSSLPHSEFWWHGPSWLISPERSWPESNHIIKDINHSNSLILVNLSLQTSSNLFDKFSTLRTLKRVITYCFRFSHNAKNKNDKHSGVLSLSELNRTMIYLIKLVQQEAFSVELNLLKNNKPLLNSSRLLSLCPFLDDDGIIRVGGRLKYSDLEYSHKHPIVLPNKHKFTILLMEQEHARLLHPGSQKLLFSIRERYWPIKGTALAKEVTRRCVVCFKQNPRFPSPKMGALPIERVTLQPPFQTTGVDYSGPIMVKNKYGRGSILLKAYLCIFICFATKAVHLELVTDLTTQCFLAALNRFISRRGRPVTVFSDNGTNFVGASRLLGKFLSDKSNVTTIQNAAIDMSFTWKFIPPYSPTWGGLWESNIKSTKSHLKRVMQNNHFTFEDTYTLLTQIEAILNSRPLYPSSNDPNDLSSITPGHLLIGRRINSVVPPEDLHIKMSGMQRFLHLQECIQSFWRRWSADYLTHCNQIYKWRKTTGEVLNVGSLVMIKDLNLPASVWSLGRILHLSEGSDLTARVATLKTSNGNVKRLTRHLAPLPICE